MMFQSAPSGGLQFVVTNTLIVRDADMAAI
jgi:hypothetical protein